MFNNCWNGLYSDYRKFSQFVNQINGINFLFRGASNFILEPDAGKRDIRMVNRKLRREKFEGIRNRNQGT